MTQTKRLTPEQLVQIRERAEKATEGPWTLSGITRSSNRPTSRQRQGICAGNNNTIATCHRAYAEWKGEVRDDPNATFIAHAREDIPNLLAHIEKQAEEIRYYKGYADRYSEVIAEQKAEIENLQAELEYYRMAEEMDYEMRRLYD